MISIWFKYDLFSCFIRASPPIGLTLWCYTSSYFESILFSVVAVAPRAGPMVAAIKYAECSLLSLDIRGLLINVLLDKFKVWHDYEKSIQFDLV